MISKHIPNFLTLLNLFSGFVGIISVFKGDYKISIIAFILALFFDFIDGFVARLLKSQSELGKQLDSLSDVISFGLLPGIMLFSLFTNINANSDLFFNKIIPYFSGILPMFTALRLGKFNIDTRQTSSFIGLPSPANAIIFASIYWLSHIDVNNAIGTFLKILIEKNWFLIALTLVCCWLLVSNIKLIAFKFTDFSLKNNIYKYVVLITSLISILFFGVSGIFLSIIIYIIISQVQVKNIETEIE